MKRIIGILAMLALANSGYAQNCTQPGQILRPVQDMSGSGSMGLYGTPDPLSESPNDTLRSGTDYQCGTQNSSTQDQNTEDQNNTQDQLGSGTPDTIGSQNQNGTQGYASENPNNNNNNNDPFFSFNDQGNPKDIYKLGTDPEFPFLAHLYSPRQVYRAMQKHADNSALNNIITSIGFTNGIQDLQVSNITAATLPDGITGNMGAGNMQTGYYKLMGANGFKAWKVTGDNGDYVFFLGACGNEFYPNPGKPGGTACINAPINVTAQPVEITANGQQNQVTDKVFVYYHIKRHHHRHMYTNPEIADNHPSRPLLLNTQMRDELVPQTYNVTLTSDNQNAMVCPDSTVNVTANINVEKTSAYSGYYSKTQDKYNLVTKREYMRAERKMRKAERKEEKVARITKTPVDFSTVASSGNS